jgi:hypothetical protein
LHQGGVSVFSRLVEDAGVQLTHVSGTGTVTVRAAGSEVNPSPRRDGLAIGFACEHCPAGVTLVLEIYQHKGSTFSGWRVTA